MADRKDEKSGSETVYRGDSFSIELPEGWRDGTLHTLVGPLEDGLEHKVWIAPEEDLPFDSVVEYAESRIQALRQELKGFVLLKRGQVSLANGLAAYEAVFRWCPSDNVRLYQRHVFVLVGRRGYRLSSAFTRRTRKTLGPFIDRILMSFSPTQGSDR